MEKLWEIKITTCRQENTLQPGVKFQLFYTFLKVLPECFFLKVLKGIIVNGPKERKQKERGNSEQNTGGKKQPVLFLVLMASLLNGRYQLSVPWLSLQDFFLCLLGGPYHLSAWWCFLLNRSSNVWYASTLNSQQKQQLYIWKQEGQLTVNGTLTASIWTQLFQGKSLIFFHLFFSI